MSILPNRIRGMVFYWVKRFFAKQIFMPLMVCVFFLLISCGKEERPNDILTPAEMVSTLTALYLTEAKVGGIPVTRDSSMRIFDYFGTKTFDSLGIADSVFKKSFNYYLDRPKEMEEIYAILIDSLNLREQTFGAPKSIE